MGQRQLSIYSIYLARITPEVNIAVVSCHIAVSNDSDCDIRISVNLSHSFNTLLDTLVSGLVVAMSCFFCHRH